VVIFVSFPLGKRAGADLSHIEIHLKGPGIMTEPSARNDIRYGASERYVDGLQGQEYFDYQRAISQGRGHLTALKFEHYVKPHHCVVDFGCGGGYVLRALKCERKIGVEINPVAREEAVKHGTSCVSALGEVPNDIADVVISNHALEHVPYPIEALREIRPKLKAHGVFLLCLPLDDWRAQRRYNPADLNHHLHTWTPLLLGHTLGEAGFRVRAHDITIVTHAWPPNVDFLWKTLPRAGFDAACGLFAMMRHRRQLLACVTADPDK
jgi:SAM-dependent methyltransferase